MEDCHIESHTLSDHGPVSMSLNLNQERLLKLWRLNVSHLNKPEVIQFIKDEIKFYLETNNTGAVSLSTLWDAAKAVLR